MHYIGQYGSMFNFNLNEASTIVVTRNGIVVSISDPALSEDNLSMTTSMSTAEGDGTYVVDYQACWPDESCLAGQLSFTVVSSTMSGY